MRIAMIGQKGIPSIYGGIEKHVEDLSLELAKRDHEVLVYARSWYTPKTTQNYRGVRIIHTPTVKTKHLDAIIHTFTSTIHALFQKPDIIHYHGVGPSLLSFIPRIFAPRIKVVATFHCIDRLHQKWGFISQFFLKLGEKAICLFPHETLSVSKTIRNYCLNKYQKITTYVPNGVHIPVKTGSKTLAKWDIKPNQYVAMVSRLVKHKGAHYLIKGWKQAKKLHPKALANHKLVIAGGSAFTDEYVESLKKIAKNDPSIVFTGNLQGQELEEIYANCALLVHPSENEGLPITVLQAMSHQRAVLASDIPEHREVINNTDFLFENKNITSLAKTMLGLLAHKERLETQQKENLVLVSTHYQWTDIAEKTEEVYNQTSWLEKYLEQNLKMV